MGHGADTAGTRGPTPNFSSDKSSEESSESTSGGDKNYPSPAAGKILSEKGISPDSVSGSGKDGRITKSDAMNAKKQSAPSKDKSSSSSDEAQPISSGGTREVRVEKMSRLRKTIAKRLTEAKNQTAMLTTFNEVDMHNVMELRKKYKDSFKDKHDIGLGFMSFFTKACTQALMEL